MLADWMGTEDALVFTTGYLANTGAIGTLLGPGDTVICDTGDHASILDAVSMSRARIRPFRHNRLDKLETMLSRAEGDGGGVLVVVDGSSRWRATSHRSRTSRRCAASTAPA